MRGVHDFLFLSRFSLQGSSPHARGPQLVVYLSQLDKRFIPACAGSTAQPRSGRGRTGVHPRMRGVHDQTDHIVVASQGSSPHARGPRTAPAVRCSPAGFIPACAGSTHLYRSLLRRAEVHPRMRGVHCPRVPLLEWPEGSSPHARGPLISSQASCNPLRFIPACAGSTAAFRSLSRLS